MFLHILNSNILILFPYHGIFTCLEEFFKYHNVFLQYSGVLKTILTFGIN